MNVQLIPGLIVNHEGDLETGETWGTGEAWKSPGDPPEFSAVAYAIYYW